MTQLTKEQTNLFTIIASILMLVAFFFIKLGYNGAPVEMIGRVGWFGTVTLILAMLAPVYSCLYAFRDQKALEPLKPIFGISPGLAFALPAIAFGLCLFANFMEGGWPIILYGAGAAAVIYIGMNSK